MTRLRNISLLYLTIILLTICCTYYLTCRRTIIDLKKLTNFLENSARAPISKVDVSITVVACGSKLEETLTMIKSALIYSDARTFLSFNIFTEQVLKQKFEDQILKLQNSTSNTFSFRLYSIQFPESTQKNWKNLFKPCAAQRLFLPSLLRNTDATLYVDTDVLFVSPPLDTWLHFKSFNASQIAGLSPEHEDSQIGWYNRFARHPYYGTLGVNSGVMLMNLTRMRFFDWENKIFDLYTKYKSKITWGDQDLINILFYYHPDKLFIFPCIFNYRPDHCMYVNVCDITNGIRILHGNRGYFHVNKQPIFKKVYETIRDLQIKNNNLLLFPYHLDRTLERSMSNSSCFRIKDKIGSQYITALT